MKKDTHSYEVTFSQLSEQMLGDHIEAAMSLKLPFVASPTSLIVRCGRPYEIWALGQAYANIRSARERREREGE